MEELTHRRFIFNEVISLNLIEKTNHKGTFFEVTIATLDDNQEEDKLVYEEEFPSKEGALIIFQNKYNCLLGLVK